METKKENLNEKKEKFETQFVIIWRGRYFGLDFSNRIIKEISFDEAFGSSFFDWDKNICISSDWCKEQYELARGEDGCGLTRFFKKRNDMRKMNLEMIKEYEKKISENKLKCLTK